MLAKFARELASDVTIKSGVRQADAKKLMTVMALGAQPGSTVVFELVGDLANAEAARLEQWCAANL